jgi:hypothetical protein
MPATLVQLKDQIIIDAQIEGDERFPHNRIVRMINLAQKYVQLRIIKLGAKKWEKKSASITPDSSTYVGKNVKTISVSTSLADLLEGMFSVLNIEVDDGSNYGEAGQVDKDKFLSQLKNTYLQPSLSNNEAVFMRLSGLIYLSPSAITTAYVHYYKTVPDLSSDSDETEIPVEYEEFIIKRAIIEINSILGKLNEKQNALNNLDTEIKEAFQNFDINLRDDNAVAMQNNARMQ